MEDKPNRTLVADPKLRKLAIAKLWAELHIAHKTDDQDLVEELEYSTLMLYMACHQVLKVFGQRKAEEDHNS